MAECVARGYIVYICGDLPGNIDKESEVKRKKKSKASLLCSLSSSREFISSQTATVGCIKLNFETLSGCYMCE